LGAHAGFLFSFGVEGANAGRYSTGIAGGDFALLLVLVFVFDLHIDRWGTLE
jgi:hypothetical protein